MNMTGQGWRVQKPTTCRTADVSMPSIPLRPVPIRVASNGNSGERARAHSAYTSNGRIVATHGHTRDRKSRTLRAGGAPRRVVPASGGTIESEALEEFCTEVDAAARWKRHREQRRLGGGQ